MPYSTGQGVADHSQYEPLPFLEPQPLMTEPMNIKPTAWGQAAVCFSIAAPSEIHV